MLMCCQQKFEEISKVSLSLCVYSNLLPFFWLSFASDQYSTMRTYILIYANCDWYETIKKRLWRRKKILENFRIPNLEIKLCWLVEVSISTHLLPTCETLFCLLWCVWMMIPPTNSNKILFVNNIFFGNVHKHMIRCVTDNVRSPTMTFQLNYYSLFLWRRQKLSIWKCF